MIAVLEAFAVSLPDVWVDTPWGDRVVKVGKKIFLFVKHAGRPSGRCVHGEAARVEGSRPQLPGCGAYRVTDSGSTAGSRSLSMACPRQEREVLFDFVEESYRAVATKTLVKRLDAQLADGSA